MGLAWPLPGLNSWSLPLKAVLQLLAPQLAALSPGLAALGPQVRAPVPNAELLRFAGILLDNAAGLACCMLLTRPQLLPAAGTLVVMGASRGCGQSCGLWN